MTDTSTDRAKLLSSLDRVRLDVTMHADMVGDGEPDNALAHWRVAAVVSPPYDDPFNTLWTREDVALRRADAADEFTIAEITGVLVDPERTDDVWSVVEEDSSASADFVCLFDSDHPGGWDPELDDELEPLGSRAVIIHTAELAPAWRGLGGVGRLLAARALRWVGGGARVYALKPFPLQFSNRGDDPGFDDARRKVCAVWESLGFEQWRDTSVWIVDPALRAFSDAVTALERDLGLG